MNQKQILKNYKFAFCFENCSIDGYLSDIIFDAMNNLSVPVYLGPKNVKQYVPESCFIDFRNFKNLEDLNKYLESIDENKYYEFISNIYSFYKSNSSEIFKMNSFINILSKNLKEDIL